MRKAPYYLMGIPEAGEKVGKSIENAADKALDKAFEKFLPEIRKMMLGSHADMVTGVQHVADRTVDGVNAGVQKVAENTMSDVKEKVVPQVGLAMKDVATHTAGVVRAELQELLSNIHFKSELEQRDPDEQLFNLLRQSFLRNGIRYLDLQALGQGYHIDTAFTDGKGVTTHVKLHVACGMLFAEYDLQDDFTQSKALLLMNSLSPLITFHTPQKGKVWCRMTVPPKDAADAALFAMAGCKFVRDVALPCAKVLKGDEDRLTIGKELQKIAESGAG